MNHPRIAIIGGGLAGLSAAVELRRLMPQAEVVLFEAKQATGGRAGSYVDPESGELVDYCQHIAMGCCTQFLSLMSEAGLRARFERYQELTFLSPGSRPVRFWKPRWLPAPFHLMPFFLQLSTLTLRQKFGVAQAMAQLSRAKPDSLRNLTASKWLVAHGQTSAMIEGYWNVVIASALGDTCERVAMHAVRKVFVEGFLDNHAASDLYVPQVPLRQLLAEQLTDYVRSLGVNVQLGRLVKSLEHKNSGGDSLRLLVNDQWETFSAVIVATPAHAMSKLLKTLPEPSLLSLARQLEQVCYSPITGVHLWFDQPLMNLPHAVFLGTLSQWAFRRPWRSTDVVVNAGSPANPREYYVQVVISASHALRHRKQSEIVGQIERELRSCFPEAATATLLRSKVVTDPNAVYSLSPEVEAIRPISTTSIPSLYLAGDLTQTDWPSTMEGAVISGKKAAAAISERYL